MQGKRILVVGYGKLGKRIANELSEHHVVYALKRSVCQQPDNLQILFADVSDLASLDETFQRSLMEGVDYLIYCLSPSERTEQAYRAAYLIGLKNIIETLPNISSLKRIIFISSTSVYHQSNGEEVLENSECLPKSFSGKVLLEAEAYIATLNTASTSVRFSGIYGAGRSRLVDQVKAALISGEVLPVSTVFTNRIHEDDCVGFICHLIQRLENNLMLEDCYIATDSYPVELSEVYQFIASQLEYSRDRKIKLVSKSTAKATRRAGSKRCLNKRMKESGYKLKFASYKDGYKFIVDH